MLWCDLMMRKGVFTKELGVLVRLVQGEVL